jgi:hypothetical protein
MRWVRCEIGWYFPSVAAGLEPMSSQADGIACRNLGQAGSGWLSYVQILIWLWSVYTIGCWPSQSALPVVQQMS